MLVAQQVASQCVGIVEMRKDRKSTRLNSSHLVISYAVFCLKKKKKYQHSIMIKLVTAPTTSHPTPPAHTPFLHHQYLTDVALSPMLSRLSSAPTSRFSRCHV